MGTVPGNFKNAGEMESKSGIEKWKGTESGHRPRQFPDIIRTVYNRKRKVPEPGKNGARRMGENVMPTQCELCILTSDQEENILWADDFCYVLSVNDPHYPGFCRVILRRHVREMTDLSPEERERLMSVVFAVEQSLRKVLRPDKINLASLGNAVPHLHWHVIPRWLDDRHFPLPIWGPPQRETAPARPAPDQRKIAAAVEAAIGTTGAAAKAAMEKARETAVAASLT